MFEKKKIFALLLIVLLTIVSVSALYVNSVKGSIVNAKISVSISDMMQGQTNILVAYDMNGSAPYSFQWSYFLSNNLSETGEFTVFSDTNPAYFTLNETVGYITFKLVIVDANGFVGIVTKTITDSAAISTFYISSGIYPGAPDYTIWTEGGIYYAKNATGYISWASTNASYVFQTVEDARGQSGSFCIKAGSYYLNNQVIIDGQGTIYGEGEANTKIYGAAGITGVFKLTHATVVRDLSFYINGAASTNATDVALFFDYGATDAATYNVLVSGFGIGMYFNRTHSANIFNPYIASCYIGMYFTGEASPDYATQFDNIFGGCITASTYAHVYVERAKYLGFYGTYFDSIVAGQSEVVLENFGNIVLSKVSFEPTGLNSYAIYMDDNSSDYRRQLVVEDSTINLAGASQANATDGCYGFQLYNVTNTEVKHCTLSWVETDKWVINATSCTETVCSEPVYVSNTETDLFVGASPVWADNSGCYQEYNLEITPVASQTNTIVSYRVLGTRPLNNMYIYGVGISQASGPGAGKFISVEITNGASNSIIANLTETNNAVFSTSGSYLTTTAMAILIRYSSSAAISTNALTIIIYWRDCATPA